MNKHATLIELGRELKKLDARERVIKTLMAGSWWNMRRLWIGWRGLRAVRHHRRALQTLIAFRTEVPARCALPKKKQRALGLMPEAASL